MFWRKKKSRNLNEDELNALAQFASCEITLKELLVRLPEIKFKFTEARRTLSFNYLVPEPGIRIESSHIEKAQAKLFGDDLKQWATMLLLSDGYEWTGQNEDHIADKLNELSMPQVFSKGPNDQQ